jgi:hypothetical protein
MTVPLPPVKPYGPPTGRYFYYEWDRLYGDTPARRERDGMLILTPQFNGLRVWGREVGSPYPEDRDPLERLARVGRVQGEWFSQACPEGEIGSMALDDIEEIALEEFSEAFERGWAPTPQAHHHHD